jgi:hypothetical protein
VERETGEGGASAGNKSWSQKPDLARAPCRGRNCPLYHGEQTSQDDLSVALAAISLIADPDLQLAFALQGLQDGRRRASALLQKKSGG